MEHTNGKKTLARPRIADGIVLLLLTAVTVFSITLLPARSPGQLLEVHTPGARYEFPLAGDSRHVIHGPLGDAYLVVESGRARLENAPCPLKICERMGPISRAGEIIVCLPNRISVRVKGERGVDAVTR